MNKNVSVCHSRHCNCHIHQKRRNSKNKNIDMSGLCFASCCNGCRSGPQYRGRLGKWQYEWIAVHSGSGRETSRCRRMRSSLPAAVVEKVPAGVRAAVRYHIHR